LIDVGSAIVLLPPAVVMPDCLLSVFPEHSLAGLRFAELALLRRGKNLDFNFLILSHMISTRLLL
jgi:hypothetical protein